MPIDYKKYPKNWKSEIRPDILKRAKNKCENCGIKNGLYCVRGTFNGERVYQDSKMDVYRESNSKFVGDWIDFIDCDNDKPAIKIVLTISHQDHNIANNDYSNLKALCQRCHFLHDVQQHKKTKRNKKQNYEIEF